MGWFRTGGQLRSEAGDVKAEDWQSPAAGESPSPPKGRGGDDPALESNNGIFHFARREKLDV